MATTNKVCIIFFLETQVYALVLQPREAPAQNPTPQSQPDSPESETAYRERLRLRLWSIVFKNMKR
jgi:hypothetical protein